MCLCFHLLIKLEFFNFSSVILKNTKAGISEMKFLILSQFVQIQVWNPRKFS